MSEKKTKKDACYHKVKSRYDVWPSAYASGALVKCRKVGAKNWGNKTDEEIELEEIYLVEEFEEHMMYDPKTGKSVKAEKEEDHIKYAKEGWTHVDPKKLEKVLKDEGGAAGMDPFVKATGASEEEIKKTLDGMPSVGQHEDGDYILEDGEEIDVLEEKKKKRKKAGTESSKESSLRDWFKRKGAKGSKGGWVDCNAPDGKGGYKSCGRGSGEKRKKYPACRPTPSACRERGKGKSWGKKGSKRKRSENLLRTMVREETQKVIFGKTISEGLAFHIDNDIPIRDNVYRLGTDRYFALINESRDLWKKGKLNLDQEDVDIMESDLGTFGKFAGDDVPLDFPMLIDEAKKKKKKKDPPIGKPKRNTGSGKKYVVYVRNPKTGKIKKITYGDAKGGLEGNWNSAEARKSYAARHRCADKKDRTKAGYWACRAHKDFGNNVPGRFW